MRLAMSGALLAYAEAVCVVARVLVTQYHTGVLDEVVPRRLWEKWAELYEAVKERKLEGGVLDLGRLRQSLRLIETALSIIHFYQHMVSVKESIWKEQMEQFTTTLHEQNLHTVFNWTLEHYAPTAEERLLVLYEMGLMPIPEVTDEELGLRATEEVHAALDFLAFQWRTGLIYKAMQYEYIAGFLDRYITQCEWHVDLHTERHFVSVNACLPATMRPIQGGTPFQKLRRLVAAVRTVPDLAALHAALDAFLAKMEVKLGAMPVDLVQDFMVATLAPPQKGNSKSPFYDMNKDIAAHIARGMLKREINRFDELP